MLNTNFVQKEKKLWIEKKRFFIPIIFVVLIFLGSIFSVFYVDTRVKKPMSGSAQEVQFTVVKGESTTEISKDLEQKGIVQNSFIFLLYLKYKGQGTLVQAGDYKIAKNLTMIQVLDIITQGKITSSKITFPEGWTNKQIEEEIVKKGIGSSEDAKNAINKKYNYDFLKESPSGDLQGFLFPDTYFVSSRPTSQEVIDKMLKEFSDKADQKIRAGAGKQGLDYYQILTLASIVEREVTSSEDKKKVASVFINRLNIGMKLDSCATVEYVLGTNKRILSEDDISIDSPYNTYKNTGLPPTPIANPGLESIEAVLSPENTNYYYFFSGKDGKTYFSENQDQHEALKAKYL
ncbi:MAG: endolytic transglycosylase MltG [bacterium]|nr:endolytic transglycosylase MltG [bacterium]